MHRSSAEQLQLGSKSGRARPTPSYRVDRVLRCTRDARIPAARSAAAGGPFLTTTVSALIDLIRLPGGQHVLHDVATLIRQQQLRSLHTATATRGWDDRETLRADPETGFSNRICRPWDAFSEIVPRIGSASLSPHQAMHLLDDQLLDCIQPQGRLGSTPSLRLP